MPKLRIGIIVGSTRPGRKAEDVARWVHEHAKHRPNAEFEVVDIAQFHLPLLDEPLPPSMGRYAGAHTKAWAAKVRSFDGFVFVTPEYNHGTSAALKNAIDYLFAEWNDKAAGFVGYGSAGGVRAVENLRVVLAEVKMATVRSQVQLSIFNDWEDFRVFKPSEARVGQLTRTLDEVVAWSGALRTVREPASESALPAPTAHAKATA
ncbi:MAG: NAD(P)H-dependent oxidoreductase [Euryarchaeota archaeon]|nr:NAD(P)H-dependent oxidoreductase [Euryarchaeota archaeon]MDE1835788.1 NAD(P)H-dependent oxidoreductase [Euryarchaeota archaeon]MDE1880738.1 NAD(P)H-dependent oxidoreductase [Euryarchaeota archaeon]MDE2043979.1 NAD(P)H-dependent oxidoreductase [Thermoplasmata archaeon]